MKPAIHHCLLTFFGVWLTGCGADSPSVQTTSTPDLVQGALDRFDANGDGTISGSEKEEMEADFISRFDLDNDGALNEAENREARRKGRVTVLASSPLPRSREEVQQFVAPLDGNGDGMISSGEVGEKQWLILQRADSDKDGFVTVDEWLARNNRMKPVPVGD